MSFKIRVSYSECISPSFSIFVIRSFFPLWAISIQGPAYVDVGTGSAFANTVATEELPDNAKIMTQKGDLLVSTVRPNRGAVAILGNGDLLVSGAFTVLREDGDYPKEVLQVLLRTSMYRDWLLRFNVGTSYPVIKDEDVLNMLKLQQRNAEAIENGAGSITTECKGFDFSITLGDDFKIATDKETQKEIIEIKLQGS